SKAGHRFPAERAAAEGASGAEVAVDDAASSVRKQHADKQGMGNAAHVERSEQAVSRAAPHGAAPGASAGRQGQPLTGLRGSMWFPREASSPTQSSSGQSSSKAVAMRATSPMEVSGSCDDDAV
ncbi:unnamed protein product, partial [Laminaria digitata]